MKPPSILIFILALIAVAFLIVSCAGVQAGSDPLIVNTERFETLADSSFQLVVSVDNADRGFWRTNAPAFHNFAEWLRAPVPISGNPNEPRGLGMILLVDSARMTYETDKSQSNVLILAISAMTNAVTQAQGWAAIVTTKTP